jgi:NADPH:quinone reductase-like Zn-dependent oxidoreductase
MKAIVYTKYGPPNVLQLKEVPLPIPKRNEVLIRIDATSVTAADYRLRAFSIPSLLFWIPARIAIGIIKPRKTILGMSFAGEIEAVGKNVTLFHRGDQVFGTCGNNFGAYAEYICIPQEGAIAIIPLNVTNEEAAVIPFGTLTALYFLRDKANIKSGQKILIYGASGAVGTASVQLAKYYGTEVTGVCSSSNVKWVKSLGADKVVDYTEEDFTNNGESYDIIFDTVGKTSFSRCKDSLNVNGKYITTVFGGLQLFQMLWTSIASDKRVICGVAGDRRKDILFIQELIEEGKLKAVIDRRYPLQQASEAHRYAEKGHKKGNVVLTLNHLHRE